MLRSASLLVCLFFLVFPCLPSSGVKVAQFEFARHMHDFFGFVN